jgi:antitoxin Phd
MGTFAKAPKTRGKNTSALPTANSWKLEDAKARFSEVVRLARSEGPQHITVRGHEAVVVISVEQLDQIAPRKDQVPFIQFMESLHLGELDLTREQDFGRDVQL